MEGVPLYSTINEALEWAVFKNTSKYHVHKYEGLAGYMGGKNYQEAKKYPGDLPTKEKIVPKYMPPMGSNVTYIGGDGGDDDGSLPGFSDGTLTSTRSGNGSSGGGSTLGGGVEGGGYE
jgi:uncharacterized membrane protein YgcG